MYYYISSYHVVPTTNNGRTNIVHLYIEKYISVDIITTTVPKLLQPYHMSRGNIICTN